MLVNGITNVNVMNDSIKERLKSYVKKKHIDIDEEKINKMVDFANS